MKKQILHLAILMLISMGASANPFSSAINIRTQDHDILTIVFDGVIYPNQTCDFSLQNITPGNHHIKVLTRERYGWYNSRFNRSIFNGWVNLNPGEEIFAVIDCFNNLKITRVVKICPPPPPPCHENQLGYYNNSYYENCNVNGKRINNYQNSFGYNSSMSPENFCSLKQSILNCNFESTRLECAKMALANNYFTSQQVAGIMNLFWFESTKLDFAKAAYSHTIDSQNYFQVNDSFSFGSSTSDLNQSIGIIR